MSQQNLESARRAYAALNKGDLSTAMADFEPGALWVEPVGSKVIGGVHRVPQEVIEGVFAKIAMAWKDFTVETNEFLEAGDRVFVLGNFKGQRKGKGQDQPVTIPFVHVIPYRNGKIAQTENHTDTATWNKVMGR